MMAFDLTGDALAKCEKYGLASPPMFWWGALPGIARADSKLSIFAPERRAALSDLIRKSEAEPSSLTPRDFAFYSGALAEAVAVLTSAEGGA